MHYFICEYCGNSGRSLFKRRFLPKCKCTGGNGKTYMTRQNKRSYISNNKNQKRLRSMK